MPAVRRRHRSLRGRRRSGDRRGDDRAHGEVERIHRRSRNSIDLRRAGGRRNGSNIERRFLRGSLLRSRRSRCLVGLNKAARFTFKIRRLLHRSIKNRPAKQSNQDGMQRERDREVSRIAELIEQLLEKRRKLFGHVGVLINAGHDRFKAFTIGRAPARAASCRSVTCAAHLARQRVLATTRLAYAGEPAIPRLGGIAPGGLYSSNPSAQSGRPS